MYLPGGSSFGPADSLAFSAATSASSTGSKLRASGELAFCHPEESAASMVIEHSAEVCV